MALTHVFGPDSDQLQEFNSQNDLSKEVSVLRSMVKEIQYYWDDTPDEPETIYLEDSNQSSTGFWTIIHPRILAVAKDLFDGGFFADSVLAAFREINSAVKAEVKELTGIEYDGSSLMTRAFSVQKPIIELGDLSTEDGRNIQQGYMQLFAGSMVGIRNPKAHGNITIDRNRAIHFLFLASLLIHKFDERNGSSAAVFS